MKRTILPSNCIQLCIGLRRLVESMPSMGRWLTIVLVVLYLCTIPIPTCYNMEQDLFSVPGSDFAAAAAATMPMLILCMFLPSIDSSAGG